MFPLIVFALISLSGCSNQTSEDVVLDTEVPIVASAPDYYTLSGKQILSVDSAVVYKFGDTMPIILDGQLQGFTRLSSVQRIGIWDLCNQSAVANGVKWSYSINLNVDLSQTLSTAENVVLTVKPYLISKDGSINGEPCSVGWSGFSSVAQLYDNTKSADIEIGLQPETTDATGANVLLVITNSVGDTYDPVYIDGDFLENAKMGNSLITDGEAKITTINGGVFTIRINSVSVNIPITTDKLESKDLTKITSYYDIDYTVTYVSAPTNDLEDLIYDSNNNNSLHTQFVTYLSTDLDNTKLLDGDSGAKRQVYSDKMKLYEYVTTQFPTIAVGESFTATINKAMTIGNSSPVYARVYFEFPEEITARSASELLDFDGRYVVFQVPITQRELQEYYESR